MMNGVRFLEILSQLGYPEASSLNPSDFDSMFDGTPENKEFIRFFCSLGSQNVLSEEEHQAYHVLEVSGKPILTEQVLEEMELLRSSAGPEEKNHNDDDDDDDEEEEKVETGEGSLEQLQQELEELRRHQRLRQRRLHQLQCLRLARDDHASALAGCAQFQSQSEGEEAGNTVKAIARENMATNAALQDLTEEMEKLKSLTLMNENTPEVQQQGQLITEQCVKCSAALLSQLPLDQYIQKAQLAHQCIMDLYKTRSAVLEEKQGVERKGEKEEEGEVQHTRKEMAKLQAAHVLIQGQLLRARAEEAGATAAKDWLCQQKHSNAKLSAPGSDGICPVAKERVCAALWRRTQQLCSGVLRGHVREQGELAEQHVLLQQRLLGELLWQKAQLDVLLHALQTERQAHAHTAAHVQGLAQGLTEEVARVAERCRQLEQLQESAPQPDPILSTTDPTVKRLLQVCETPKETDGWLASVADITAVAAEQRAELQQLGETERVAAEEQLRLVVGLERDCRRLEQWVGPLQGPPTSGTPAPTSQLCPSAQELTQVVQELEQQSSALYRQLQEVTADVSSRRAQLERSTTLRKERELYTLFHLDPATLVRLVEEQENRE